MDIFNGKRPHCWCYVKEANETHFSMYLCILWNNLILYLFSDESAATHFFSSKMDSTNKMQRFIDLTMGLKLNRIKKIVNKQQCTVIQIDMLRCQWLIANTHVTWWYGHINTIILKHKSFLYKRTNK